MALREMAEEYRQSAHLLDDRIEELRRLRRGLPWGEKRSAIEARLWTLLDMRAQTLATAAMLERYYDERIR